MTTDTYDETYNFNINTSILLVEDLKNSLLNSNNHKTIAKSSLTLGELIINKLPVSGIKQDYTLYSTDYEINRTTDGLSVIPKTDDTIIGVMPLSQNLTNNEQFFIPKFLDLSGCTLNDLSLVSAEVETNCKYWELVVYVEADVSGVYGFDARQKYWPPCSDDDDSLRNPLSIEKPNQVYIPWFSNAFAKGYNNYSVNSSDNSLTIDFTNNTYQDIDEPLYTPVSRNNEEMVNSNLGTKILETTVEDAYNNYLNHKIIGIGINAEKNSDLDTFVFNLKHVAVQFKDNSLYNNKLVTFNHDEPNVNAAIYLKNLNTDSILDTLITLPGDDSLYEMPYDAIAKINVSLSRILKTFQFQTTNDTTLFKVNKEQDFSTFEDASFNNPDNNFLVDENNELVSPADSSVISGKIVSVHENSDLRVYHDFVLYLSQLVLGSADLVYMFENKHLLEKNVSENARNNINITMNDPSFNDILDIADDIDGSYHPSYNIYKYLISNKNFRNRFMSVSKNKDVWQPLPLFVDDEIQFLMNINYTQGTKYEHNQPRVYKIILKLTQDNN